MIQTDKCNSEISFGTNPPVFEIKRNGQGDAKNNNFFTLYYILK